MANRANPIGETRHPYGELFEVIGSLVPYEVPVLDFPIFVSPQKDANTKLLDVAGRAWRACNSSGHASTSRVNTESRIGATGLLRYLLLVFGVWACSTAVIFIKESTIRPVLLSSLRLFVAAIALTPIFLRHLRRHRDDFTAAHLRATILPGIMLALHFITWIQGARMTDSANASLIVNLVPIAMPFLLYFLMREKLSRREGIATVLALTGLFILSGSDYRISVDHFYGDLTCFGSMLLFAFYLALSRKNQQFKTLWLYVVPLYYIAAIVCLLAASCIPNQFEGITESREIVIIVLLGLIPTVLGHSILNYSMKNLRGQVVSLINMGQFVFAGIMAYFRFNEIPQWTFYLASAILVAGVTIAVTKLRRAGDQCNKAASDR